MVRKLLIRRKGRKILESDYKETLRLVKLPLDKEMAWSGNVNIFVCGGLCVPEEVKLYSRKFSKDVDRKVMPYKSIAVAIFPSNKGILTTFHIILYASIN